MLGPGQYAIEGAITLVATFLGVLFAFWLESVRKRREASKHAIVMASRLNAEMLNVFFLDAWKNTGDEFAWPNITNNLSIVEEVGDVDPDLGLWFKERMTRFSSVPFDATIPDGALAAKLFAQETSDGLLGWLKLGADRLKPKWYRDDLKKLLAEWEKDDKREAAEEATGARPAGTRKTR
jgi:hypothetical protein